MNDIYKETYNYVAYVDANSQQQSSSRVDLREI
jgi:hypothetical protein